MLANLPKRRAADAWGLETTTAYTPGEGSVAENTHAYAAAVLEGRTHDSRLFFFHRQASESHDLATPEGRRAAVLEASGPVAGWSNIEGILEQWDDPRANLPYLRRVWLNQHVQAESQGFDLLRWEELAQAQDVPAGSPVVLGFKANSASVAIVAAEIRTGYVWLVKSWQRPHDARGESWTVGRADVSGELTAAFARWNVWRLYADPRGWDDTLDTLNGTLRDRRKDKRRKDDPILAWSIAREAKFAAACRVFADAVTDGSLTHDGHEVLAAALGAVRRREIKDTDENGARLWVATKERDDSPAEITAAVAAILAWDCRRDALAEGVGLAVRSQYEDRAPLSWADIQRMDEQGVEA